MQTLSVHCAVDIG